MLCIAVGDEASRRDEEIVVGNKGSSCVCTLRYGCKVDCGNWSAAGFSKELFNASLHNILLSSLCFVNMM